MKKGFTLLEVIIVIIIIGILATLGLTQFGRIAEKARGAEAKAIIGTLRDLGAAFRLERGTVAGITNPDFGLGTGAGDVPSACAGTHYFSYGAACVEPSCTFTATRCTGGGKIPQGGVAGTLTLATNYTSGLDTWGGTGGY